MPVNPYPSMCIPDDPIREAQHVAWSEGYRAALAAVLSDRAVEAGGLVAVNESAKWDDGVDARPYSRVSPLNRPWIDAVFAVALRAAVDAVKEGEGDE